MWGNYWPPLKNIYNKSKNLIVSFENFRFLWGMKVRLHTCKITLLFITVGKIICIKVSNCNNDDPEDFRTSLGLQIGVVCYGQVIPSVIGGRGGK